MLKETFTETINTERLTLRKFEVGDCDFRPKKLGVRFCRAIKLRRACLRDRSLQVGDSIRL